MGVESLFDSLPNHWETVTLGEACKLGGGDVQTGPFGSQLHASDYVPVGIPSIMPKNIGENRVDTTDIARITAEDAKRLSRYLVKPGDIVYSRRGDVERRALIREEENGWLCGTGCLRVRFGKGIVDPLYASYYLGHPIVRAWIVRHAIGATMPNLNTSILSYLPFVVPPLDEQKAIAQILSSLDDKIELNQQMNQTLEAIARALFKSWFIDFDPVRAKMDGRQPASMDAETAALFPAEFEDSAIGKIPKGWRVGTLENVIEVNSRSITKNYPHQVIQYVDISSVTVGRLEGTTVYELSDAPSRAKRLVQHGDTIWSGVRPNRKSYLFIHTPPKNLVVSTGFIVLSPKAIPPSYLYAWVTTDEFVDYLAFNADGSAYPAVRPDRFSDAQILIPWKGILDQFEQQVSFIRDKIIQNERESIVLASIRDSILPKLLSGEIRLKDAEKVIEEVV